jgi:hypothetical protein
MLKKPSASLIIVSGMGFCRSPQGSALDKQRGKDVLIDAGGQEYAPRDFDRLFVAAVAVEPDSDHEQGV